MPKQIYFFSGGRGDGKSMALATYTLPTKESMKSLVIVDTEDSMSAILKNLNKLDMPPGEYIRMYDRFKLSEDMLSLVARGEMPWVDESSRKALANYLQFFLDELNRVLDPNIHKVLAIDTIEPIELAITVAVEANRKRYGWSGSHAYGRKETEGVRPALEGIFEAIHKRGIDTFLLSSHLKRVWEDDTPVVNKVKPGGRLTMWSRLTTGMFWLFKDAGNAGGAPAACVLKCRHGELGIVDGEWKPRRMLPRRIPAFSWATLRQYLKDGCDLANPAPGEVPTHQEQKIISEFLSDEQMRLMMLAAETELAQAQSQSVLTAPGYGPTININKIKALRTEGKSFMDIAKELGYSVPEVLRALKS